MPELPEVEHAVRRLRPHVEGRVIVHVQRWHAATRRALPPAAARAVAGRRVEAVERRGKYQCLRLDDGATIVAHFRLDGDWHVDRDGESPAPHARAALCLDDGARACLVDPRAFATLERRPPGTPAVRGLGPEPWDPVLDGGGFRARFVRRRAPIKAVLLDQGVLAGVGNIYAAEALWRAGIRPSTPAHRVGEARAARLLAAVRAALEDGLAHHGRVFATADTPATEQPLAVYGRAGRPCERCGAPVRRTADGHRGTYWCPRCQR